MAKVEDLKLSDDLPSGGLSLEYQVLQFQQKHVMNITIITKV